VFAKSASVAEQADELKSVGLQEVKPEDNALDTRNSFQHLGYLGGYVVETANEATADKAKEALEADYLIVPDIPLGLPTPQLSTVLSRRPATAETWPIESGVGAAHQAGVNGQGVLVGVLDTGCDADHSEFQKKRVEFRYVSFNPQMDEMRVVRGFDTHGHGTHVCGIIAGRNIGVAPGVDLMMASGIESETIRTSLSRIVTALNWMLSQFQIDANLNKPTIINMSLGFLPEWLTGANLIAAVNGMKLVIGTLVNDFDVLPVIAIGNDGPNKMRLPGSFAEVLAVGAVDTSLQPANFSGGGIAPETGETKPDVAGYGVQVVSSLERTIDKRSVYARMSGTSMATPFVTGIAALTAQAYPGLHGLALRQHLIDHALPLSAPSDRVGAGLARFS
jgi:subtilisin family serine protease